MGVPRGPPRLGQRWARGQCSPTHPVVLGWVPNLCQGQQGMEGGRRMLRSLPTLGPPEVCAGIESQPELVRAGGGSGLSVVTCSMCCRRAAASTASTAVQWEVTPDGNACVRPRTSPQCRSAARGGREMLAAPRLCRLCTVVVHARNRAWAAWDGPWNGVLLGRLAVQPAPRRS